MTKEELIEQAELAKVWKPGEPLMFEDNNKTMWTLGPGSRPCWGNYFYRRPPQPKLRQWRPDEVPQPCFVREKSNDNVGWMMITDVDEYGVVNNSLGITIPYETLKNDWVQTNDEPCGVYE